MCVHVENSELWVPTTHYFPTVIPTPCLRYLAGPISVYIFFYRFARCIDGAIAYRELVSTPCHRLIPGLVVQFLDENAAVHVVHYHD